MTKTIVSKEALMKTKQSRNEEEVTLFLSKFYPNQIPFGGKKSHSLESAIQRMYNELRTGDDVTRERLAMKLREFRAAHGIIMPDRVGKDKESRSRLKKARSQERHMIKKTIKMELDSKSLARVRSNSEKATPSRNVNMYAPVSQGQSSTRRKSEAQDILTVTSLNKELEKLRSIKKNDPNALDRSAMK